MDEKINTLSDLFKNFLMDETDAVMLVNYLTYDP